MEDRLPIDPFPDIPDPALYVPREASDRALARLAACAQRPDRPAALLAPPGLGKTLLLHTLATRLVPELRSVYVPNPALSPSELCAWTLGRLGSPAWSEPIQVVAAYAAHLAQRGGALVWLVDDAHGLPGETARWLGRVLVQSGGALRLVVAALDDERAKTLDALGPLVRVQTLARPMSADETRSFVVTRLQRRGVAAGAWTPGDDDATLRAIQRVTGGVPRRVGEAVSALLAERPVAF